MRTIADSPRWQRRHPLTQPELPFAFLRSLADGVGASVRPTHGEGVCGTSRHDQRHVGTRFGRRIRHLGHLHINRFFKSRRYSAGDLLGIAGRAAATSFTFSRDVTRTSPNPARLAAVT